MPFWNRSQTKASRVSGPGGNVVYTSASSGEARLDVLAVQLDALQAGEYVIFGDRAHVDDYVQFARNDDGSLVMEVASGAYATSGGRKLSDDSRAVTTLASLGLTAGPDTNFSAASLTVSSATIANWVEGIFVNLFRADESFTMDVLGDPARLENL